jgi:hypothetical protein
VRVIETARLKDIEKFFVREKGWTGGDGVYSLMLPWQESLWLFGDSFIGTIKDGKRTEMKMVHNSAAVWSHRGLPRPGRIAFFWKAGPAGPRDLLEPPNTMTGYFWPGVPVMANGRLAVFCKRVINKSGGREGFDFDWVSQELVLVSQPQKSPADWQYQVLDLPGGEAGIFPGAAAVSRDGFVYVYGTIEDRSRPAAHPCVLMRIREKALARGEVAKFQYWCHRNSSPQSSCHWSAIPLYPAVLFADGAPEFSVGAIADPPGLLAVYSPNGLSDRILLRYAARPEGPWSDPLEVYRCPEPAANPHLLCYGAKAHFGSNDSRTLTITYCLNPGGLEQHQRDPFDYFPKFLSVTLAKSEVVCPAAPAGKEH